MGFLTARQGRVIAEAIVPVGDTLCEVSRPICSIITRQSGGMSFLLRVGIAGHHTFGAPHIANDGSKRLLPGNPE
jgi:hypothetical protein